MLKGENKGRRKRERRERETIITINQPKKERKRKKKPPSGHQEREELKRSDRWDTAWRRSDPLKTHTHTHMNTTHDKNKIKTPLIEEDGSSEHWKVTFRVSQKWAGLRWLYRLARFQPFGNTLKVWSGRGHGGGGGVGGAKAQSGIGYLDICARYASRGHSQ